MRFLILFVLAILVGVHCSGDLDSVSPEKIADYQSCRDLDAFFSGECEEHEEYSECSGDPTCRRTCENMDRWETMACARAKICIRGRVCVDGYVRDDRDVCIREADCPPKTTITLQPGNAKGASLEKSRQRKERIKRPP